MLSKDFITQNHAQEQCMAINYTQSPTNMPFHSGSWEFEFNFDSISNIPISRIVSSLCGCTATPSKQHIEVEATNDTTKLDSQLCLQSIAFQSDLSPCVTRYPTEENCERLSLYQEYCLAVLCVYD